MPGANRSTMPPRMAYSPASRTVEARMKPLSSSHSVIPDMAMTLPGAAASDWRDRISRGGTRCSMALTVASRIAGRSRPLMRASRASVVMRCATTPACGDTRSYGRQSQAGNSSTSTSGAKKVSERDSAAMREPSRQITARLIAGADGRAATARARSASTSPSAPSATPERCSGRPGASRSAGDRAGFRTWVVTYLSPVAMSLPRLWKAISVASTAVSYGAGALSARVTQA